MVPATNFLMDHYSCHATCTNTEKKTSNAINANKGSISQVNLKTQNNLLITIEPPMHACQVWEVVYEGTRPQLSSENSQKEIVEMQLV